MASRQTLARVTPWVLPPLVLDDVPPPEEFGVLLPGDVVVVPPEEDPWLVPLDAGHG